MTECRVLASCHYLLGYRLCARDMVYRKTSSFWQADSLCFLLSSLRIAPWLFHPLLLLSLWVVCCRTLWVCHCWHISLATELCHIFLRDWLFLLSLLDFMPPVLSMFWLQKQLIVRPFPPASLLLSSVLWTNPTPRWSSFILTIALVDIPYCLMYRTIQASQVCQI